MQAHRMRRYWLASCILLLFFAAGCFQPAGANLEATSIAQSMPTFTSVPTETPFPTDTPASTPTETPTESSIVTLEGIIPIASDTPDPMALLTGTEVAALPEQVDDPVAGTATALALQTQGIAPQQAEGTPTETLDPFYITATFIVGNATNAAAAPQTQTAEAILGVTATPQPSATTQGVPAATAAPSGSCVHTVVAGQNLFRISLQYNTTVDALAAANGIVNPAMIIAGQQLTIPGCGTTSPQTTPGTTTGSGTVYVVQQGDTLFEISLQYGVTVNALATRNNISNINLILIGQQIVIP